VLEVLDDGVGPPSEAGWAPASLGLVAMHERAIAVGGEMSLSGRREGGAAVTAWVPAPSR
jgi:signal transduction histidine kinase